MLKAAKAKTLGRLTRDNSDTDVTKPRARTSSVLGSLKGKLWRRNRSNTHSENVYFSSRSSTLPGSRHKPLEGDETLVRFEIPARGINNGPIKSFHYSMENVEDCHDDMARKNSTESTDSGVESSIAVDMDGVVVAEQTERSVITLCARYNDRAVDEAFGPMKDLSRWYQYQMEQDRLNRRPPCPLPPDNYVGMTKRDSSSPEYRAAAAARNEESVAEDVKPEDKVYEIVKERADSCNGLSLGLRDLAKQGWYWGPVTRHEAEEKLIDQPDGTFLVRDSSNDRYLLSVSFRSQARTLHTRIEYGDGHFSFFGFPQSDVDRFKSVVELIEKSVEHSKGGIFCFSRAGTYHSVAIPVRLSIPFSRFKSVQTLQHRCRFVIRQHTRFDLIRELPLPKLLHNYLQESHIPTD